MFSMHLFRHQQAYINMLRKHTDIPYVFLIGGFGCGKSASDVALCLYLIEEYMYHEEPINVGILGVTIKLLKQTVIAELEKALDRGGVPYKDNSQQGRLTVGNLTFIYLQMADPDDIYAHNFHCAIVDELDELPPEKVDPVIKAIQERCRKIIPASKTCPQREPFIAFSTTAQGLGGTYQLIQKLQEQGVPYAVIRGRTQDNTSLAPSQLKLLRALYTEEEARAYLDGEFINLANGRVYPEFDRSRHMCTPFPIKPNDTLYVGADFNAGANASSVCVVRGNNIYVVATYRWHYVAEQAVKLRDMYPENKIILIPDASGKEIMSGFAEEFKDQDIEIYWNGTNPPVLERITAINKLFRLDRLKVFPKCKNLLLNLETRDFDDNTGKPRKGGVKSYDHEGDSCFPAGTMITTLRGMIPIEEVTVGDYVMSHDCTYRRVKKAWCTGLREVHDYGWFTATPNHPVFDGRTFVPAERATIYIRYTREEQEWLRLLYLMALLIGDTLKQLGRVTGTITELALLTSWLAHHVPSTVQCTSIIMDLFQKVIMCIIKMETSTTTLQRIWRLLKLVSIARSTISAARSLISDPTQRAYGRLQNGIGVQKDIGGTRETVTSGSESVRCVTQSLLRRTKKRAENRRTRRARSSAVVPTVSYTTPQSVQAVYNLSVTGTHTYLAESTVVHNCEYAIWHILHTVKLWDNILNMLKARRHSTYKEVLEQW